MRSSPQPRSPAVLPIHDEGSDIEITDADMMPPAAASAAQQEHHSLLQRKYEVPYQEQTTSGSSSSNSGGSNSASDGIAASEGVERVDFFGRKSTYYNIEAIARHQSPDDCWLAAHDRVYDVTSFLSRHPAGEFAILRHGGTDSSTDCSNCSVGSGEIVGLGV